MILSLRHYKILSQGGTQFWRNMTLYNIMKKYLPKFKTEYGNREFCKAIKCPRTYGKDKNRCSNCRAYKFHNYLNANGYKIVKG